MSQTVDELLDAIDQALALMKKTDKARFLNEVDSLVRVKRVLEGLDPEEVEALLEDDDEDDQEAEADDEDEEE
jgi:Mg/Co/Ni transporter MgtE